MPWSRRPDEHAAGDVRPGYRLGGRRRAERLRRSGRRPVRPGGRAGHPPHQRPRGRGASDVVSAGLAQDYCVRETALDARRLGYTPTVVEDATRAVNLNPGDDRRAAGDMVEAGVRLV